MLLNAKNSWPNPGRLNVDGFVYEHIDSEASPNAEVQLQWLARQSADRFVSQPYEQLATVFRNMGLERDARAVLIQKNREQARHLHWRPEWLWYGFFGKVIDYGYRPWRAFYISLVVIAIGWFAFRVGYDWKLMTPTGSEPYPTEKQGKTTAEKDQQRTISPDYPKFNAFVYSVETFVPLLKLGIGERWAPNAHSGPPLNVGSLGYLGFPRTGGSLLRYYLWFHIVAGWVLTTLWIGGLTGLVKT
jgi:hypothetical protein